MEGPSPPPKQARYQKVPDGTLEDNSHLKKKKLPLHVVTNSKSYNTDDGEIDDDDNHDDDDNDSSVSSRDSNDNEQYETNSLVSPSKLNESIFRSVTEDTTVISRKRSGDQSLTGSHHHLMPTSRNNSSLLDDDELGDFASDWDDDEINLSRYNNAIYYSNNGNTTTTTMHSSSNSSHNNNNNPFQVVRDVPLPAEFDDSSIQQRCRRWWYLAQTHWNGMRYSARQRRAARLLSLPSETHRVYVCILTVCCDATDIGIAVAAVSVILWIVLGGIARMGPTYWWLGLTLFMLRISARRCYNMASTWCLNSTAVRRVRRLRTNSDLHHHHHHQPQHTHRHHPVANTDDMDLSPPPAWTMMTPISEQNTSTATTTTTNNNSRRGRPHGDIGISLKHGDSSKAASPNPATPTSV